MGGAGAAGGGQQTSAESVQAASTIVQFIAAVRPGLFRKLRLADDPNAQGQSGGPAASTSTELPMAIAREIQTPLPVLRPDQTLQWNIANQFEGRISRQLTVAEHVALHEGIHAALYTLMQGDAAGRRAIMELNVMDAMSSEGVLLLLTCLRTALLEAPPPIMPQWLDNTLEDLKSRCVVASVLITAQFPQ